MKTKIAKLLLVLLIIGIGLRLSVLPVRVSGDSMEPNLHSGAFLLMKRALLFRAPLRRYDLVVARFGGDLIIKRVIAFPGEWVRMTNGVVSIDGVQQDEPFPVRRGTWSIKTGQVEPGKLLLIGDNRALPLQAFYIVPQQAVIARRNL
jgi:signal peptidase I